MRIQQHVRGLVGGRPFGMYSPGMFGAKGDGSTDDRAAVAAADAAANAQATITVPPGTHSIQSALTIASAVRFTQGAILKPANGVTITIDGPIEAGLYQIFDESAGGSIAFGASTVREIYPQWWGAAPGDVVTPATNVTAIQAAIDAAAAAYSAPQTVRLTPGVWKVNSTLTIDTGNVRLVGNGARSELRPTTPISVLKLAGTALEYVSVDDLYINGDGTASVGLFIENHVEFTIRNVVVFDCTGGIGIKLDAPQNGTFENVTGKACGTGLQINNGAGHNLFLGCTFKQNTVQDVIFKQDNTLTYYDVAIFEARPTHNVFDGCVIEDGTGTYCLNLDNAVSNYFFGCGINRPDNAGASSYALRCGANSEDNVFFACNFHGKDTVLGAILQNGDYNRFFYPRFHGFDGVSPWDAFNLAAVTEIYKPKMPAQGQITVSAGSADELVQCTPMVDRGPTATRPALGDQGAVRYLDTDLGKWITYIGGTWLDMDGTAL